MTAVFSHSILKAGGFQSVQASIGSFPGGEFCYKTTVRDYATSMSLAEGVGKDMGIGRSGFADTIYTLYLDDPREIGAEKLRFAAGNLAQTDESRKVNHGSLLPKNEHITPPSAIDLDELPVRKLWLKLPYQTAELPKVENAVVVHFPFTNGFVSSLLFTYKVLPSLLDQARKHIDAPEPMVIMSTCSVSQQMCTFYAVSGEPFLLGQPRTDDYVQETGPTPLLPWDGMKKSLVQPFVWMGLVSKHDGASDEL